MNDHDKRLAEASKTLGGNVMKMIGLILQKHNAAVIEASMEAIEAAVAAEREARAQVCDGVNRDGNWFAAAIRARGQA